jgi:hypothetical protein
MLSVPRSIPTHLEKPVGRRRRSRTPGEAWNCQFHFNIEFDLHSAKELLPEDVWLRHRCRLNLCLAVGQVVNTFPHIQGS